MDTETISLRPMSLRPGGGAGLNPFASFGKGAAPKGLTRVRSCSIHTRRLFRSPTHPAVFKAAVADAGPEQPRKPASEIVRYSRDALLQFSANCTHMPATLDAVQSDCIIAADDPDGAGAREAAQRLVPELAAEGDDRDWRSRSALPEAPAGTPAAAEAGPPRRAPPSDGPPKAAGVGGGGASKRSLQTAEDIGRKAWMPGSVSAEGDEQALKQVKGVLNKLTPEKFERLLEQLLDAVKSVEVLRGLITLVFENAVAQPTFVAMYALLCSRLGSELPELAPPEGETQPMSFQRLLLNTCQEEFEGTADARASLTKLSGLELEAAERATKQRTLGNIRLIGELFNKEVVRENILHVCMSDLQGEQAAVPTEDNVEVLCEILTITGKRLDEVTKKRTLVEGYFASLEKLAKSGKLPSSRIRFLVRDLLDLRRNKWVPRREKIQAKKLDEIRAEAHAELGMMPALAIAQLPQLLGLKPLVSNKPSAEEEVELFPALRGGDVDWRSALKAPAGTVVQAQYSAFLGAYTPVEARVEAAAAAPNGAPAADSNATPPETTAKPVEYNKKLTQEERESRAGGLFAEYVSSGDAAEALLSTQELAAPGFLPKLVECGIQRLLDCTEPRQHSAITQLLVSLVLKGGYSAADLQAGVSVFSAQMEDLQMDAPLAPKLIGGIVGLALAEGALPAAALPELASPIESAEPRRAFVVESLKRFKADGGEKKLIAAAAAAGWDLVELLKSDPEFDPTDLPSVPELLKAEGLEAASK